MTAVDGFFSNADYKGAISKDNDPGRLVGPN